MRWPKLGLDHFGELTFKQGAHRRIENDPAHSPVLPQMTDNGLQSFGRCTACHNIGEHAEHRPHRFSQQYVLSGEMLVEGRSPDIGALGDVGDAEAVVPALEHQFGETMNNGRTRALPATVGEGSTSNAGHDFGHIMLIIH